MVWVCAEDGVGDGWCWGVEGDGGQVVKKTGDIGFANGASG